MRFGIIALLASTLGMAQDLAGDWQGILKTGGQDLRIVLQLEHGENGGWKATSYSLDQAPDGVPATSVTLEGSNLKVVVDALRGVFEGKFGADGKSLVGNWMQGQPLPLELHRATQETSWRQPDSSPHTAQFVTVDAGVKLEVLDWGGPGRPVVLLTGLGNNAHVFDKFAPKLNSTYHVYGITRRGFGVSSVPAYGYSADRLGDDVLAVVDALKLKRPVLVGHSIGGEELSSIGSRHPEKVAGLIYLDAGYPYAYYDRARGDLLIDSVELLKKLEQLQPGKQPADPRQLVKDLLETSMPAVERELREAQKKLPAIPEPQRPPLPAPEQAILAGMQKYTAINVPILAIYAVPHDPGPQFKGDRAKAEADDLATGAGAQANAFEKGLPSARVVRLAHADHYVFRSNEADVLREMNAFISSLQP